MPATFNIQERIAEELKRKADPIARDIAHRMGKATDTQEINQEEELRLWSARDTSVDPTELLAQGMPIDQIVDAVYPNRRKMVTYTRPNPKDQVSYAERMAKLVEEHGGEDAINQKFSIPSVHNESGGELQSTTGAY